MSSIAVNVNGSPVESPPSRIHAEITGVSSALNTTLLIVKAMSSTVTGSPSDHFMPSRSLKVNRVPSALTS